MTSGPVSYTVRGGIRTIYERNRSGYGRPLHNEVKISENGGGWFQQFENGLITYSQSMKKGQGLLQGSFLEEYLERGGAMGEWGFISGQPKGRVADGNRTLEFQHGVARYDAATGVSFTPSA
nr:hypothetical protein [Leucobacter sp. PH1c]